MSYQTSSKRSPPFWRLIGARKTQIFPRGSSRHSLLFLVPYFSARLNFPSPPLSAPGSPRMVEDGDVGIFVIFRTILTYLVISLRRGSKGEGRGVSSRVYEQLAFHQSRNKYLCFHGRPAVGGSERTAEVCSYIKLEAKSTHQMLVN